MGYGRGMSFTPRRGAAWLVLSGLLLGATACQASVPEDLRTTQALPSPTGATGQPLAAAAGEHNAADTMFAEMMRVHHEQALTLSDLVLAKPGLDPRVRAMAQQIKAAQTPEIDQMVGWLAGWGITPGSMGDHTGHMTGMVSQADLEKIRAADGASGQKLFLKHMIEHHEGAVDMAEDELRLGLNPDAKALARTIIAAQEKEISEMRALLKSL